MTRASRSDPPLMPFKHMCIGLDPKAVSAHEEKAQYHSMMAKFYALSASNQRVFIAMFNQLVNDSKQENQS